MKTLIAALFSTMIFSTTLALAVTNPPHTPVERPPRLSEPVLEGDPNPECLTRWCGLE